ncbi:DUF1127 domain-containing protein [Ruegeria marina]|uniref:Uncharacterized conserved protein YjiS, DUF1127 family n=1 Tax=Ruegeria marina TaxID=639004 RepID=A0A1G7AX34_9RHOB|nr:DUF1127 domain-containing protein [Ruegeria marina]SDE19438.1 Uncharacterized conserved protein YjiS, DUF1127 family [Ruegeria marina]
MTAFTATRPCHPVRASWRGYPRRLAALWRQRRALANLDDRALEDIGLSRAQADAEARRPFWDAPDFWRC